MGEKGGRELGGLGACSPGALRAWPAPDASVRRGGGQGPRLAAFRGCAMLPSLIQMGNAGGENVWRNHQFYLGHGSSNSHPRHSSGAVTSAAENVSLELGRVRSWRSTCRSREHLPKSRAPQLTHSMALASAGPVRPRRRRFAENENGR